ncbi:MAG: DUF11 domain-containing protein, partial [Burkholderiales bacterium]
TAGTGVGGRGGAAFAERVFTRIALGGGGGGGSAGTDAATTAAVEASVPWGTGTNVFSRGGAGGGIVIIGAETRTGALTVNALGQNAPFSPGATNAIQVGGGGGAGGSVVLYGTGGTIAVDVSGGDGATAQRTTHRAHGGGGGGGAVFAAGALTGITTTANAGRAGCTVAGANDTGAASCNLADVDSSKAGTVGGASVFAASAGPGAPGCVPANISVAKTNSVSSVSAGQTFNYALTVVNGGPNAANNSVLNDVPDAGLNCTAVSCTGSIPAGNCPSAGTVTIGNLLGAGIALPTLPSNSTLTFQVSCGVTATGQ